MSKNLSDIFPPTEIGGGGGGGIEEAPKTGKLYARKDEAWEEFATGNLDDGNQDGEILTWDTASANWTHDDTLIVKDGNVGIGTTDASSQATGASRILKIDGSTSSNAAAVALESPNGEWELGSWEGTLNGSFAVFNGKKGTFDFTINPAGNATFSGTVNASHVDATSFHRGSIAGISFTVGVAGPCMYPTGGGGSASGAVVDLGNGNSGGARFRDAYLSGSVNAGDATFSGQVNAAAFQGVGIYRSLTDACGIQFDPGKAVTPLSETGGRVAGQVSLGTSTWKWKDAHFSGTVNCGGIVANGQIDTPFNVRARNYSLVDGGWLGWGDSWSIKLTANVSTGTLNIDADVTHFSGIVDAIGFYRDGQAGWGFTTNQFIALDTNHSFSDGVVSLGASNQRLKDAHFSGTINAAQFNGRVTDVGDHIKAITPTQIALWDAGTSAPPPGGGNIDSRISDNDIIHWNEAWDWGDHSKAGYQPAGSYLTQENDPTVPSHVKSITTTDIASWDAKQPAGNYALVGASYTKSESDAKYQPVGNYATAGTSYTKSESDAKYSLAGASYTKSESDAKYELKGAGGLPAGNWHCTGSITAEGNITAYAPSDERLKDDIEPMPVGLIDAIKPVKFKWKNSGKHSGGVIAQQLQECGLSDFVSKAPNGDLGVDYNALVGVLLAEVAQLKAQVQELKGGN